MVRPRGEKWFAAVSKVPDCFVEDKVMKNRPTEKSVVSIKFGGSRRGTKEYHGGRGLPGGIYPCSFKILLN